VVKPNRNPWNKSAANRRDW